MEICLGSEGWWMFLSKTKHKCAATWQNQQSECAPSEDSDQPGHPPSLIRVFAVRMKKPWALSSPLSAQRRLIRLGGCPGWSKSSLGGHSLCWFCHVVAQIDTENVAGPVVQTRDLLNTSRTRIRSSYQAGWLFWVWLGEKNSERIAISKIDHVYHQI